MAYKLNSSLFWDDKLFRTDLISGELCLACEFEIFLPIVDSLGKRLEEQILDLEISLLSGIGRLDRGGERLLN